MQININDIILGDLTSELINSKNEEEKDEIYINVNISEQDLKDFNDRIINPSNINAIIKLCDFLMINYEEMKMLIINHIKPGNEKYVLNEINKSNCKDLLFLENITIDDILEYDLIEWLKFKFNEYNKHTLCEKSAEKGAIKCLKYAHENGCFWDKETCRNASKNGQLECLKYAHENGCYWNEFTAVEAAVNGQLECLKYLHDNKCEWHVHVCTFAANKGHLECLKYAHENGCPWDECSYLNAKLKKKYECLNYMNENGCPQW
jgi:hypothetical protein